MERKPAIATQMIDDARVRVTRFDFAPDAETGWHTHAYDYVIAAVTDCAMLLENPDGAVVEVLIPAGTAYRRDAGVKHNVINRGRETMTFVEVELK
ncbi:MAG: cupin domain-containing protein [Yoonia sp.]|nr:cupin domain-containing protein [Yoonia sp.]